MVDLTGITRRFTAVRGILDERSRRLVAAAESAAIGRGGVSAVARATGMSRQVIRQGMSELSETGVHPPGRVRRPGGGRKKCVAQDPSLLRDLERLVEPVTRGDPESPLRWTCKSLRKLAEELRQMGQPTSHPMVGRMLHDLGGILEQMDRLAEIDTEGVAPMSQVLYDAVETATLRPDVERAPLGNKLAVENAPVAGAGYFKVPLVIER